MGGITTDLTIFGDKLYQKRARKTLPILVRQARAEQPITYGDLAYELGMKYSLNLNYVLGAIGSELVMLSKKWGLKIPAIQALVINKNTGVPGSGVYYYAKDAADYWKWGAKKRKRITKIMWEHIFAFDKWDKVLEELSLQTEKPALGSNQGYNKFSNNEIEESEEHRLLKEYISKNPQSIGLLKKDGPGKVEYTFQSGDIIDVLFKTDKGWIGAEVKSSKSNTQDINRGLFQCVKYKALIEATLAVEQLSMNCRVILVLADELPKELVPIKHVLGVEIIEKIDPCYSVSK